MLLKPKIIPHILSYQSHNHLLSSTPNPTAALIYELILRKPVLTMHLYWIQ